MEIIYKSHRLYRNMEINLHGGIFVHNLLRYQIESNEVRSAVEIKENVYLLPVHRTKWESLC